MKNHLELDWDKISINEAYDRIELLKNYDVIESIELRQSATNGYHVYVKLYRDMEQDEIFRLRRSWKDDGKRLMMDCFWRLNNNKNNSNVMFQSKRINGLLWYELPLILYTRTRHEGIWKEQKLRKKRQ